MRRTLAVAAVIAAGLLPLGLASPAAASGSKPTVTGVSPDKGPAMDHHVTVTVTGTNLSGATEVDFGTTKGTAVSVNGAGTALTVLSPAHAPGKVHITVTTPAGTSSTSAADEFTFLAAPTLNSVNPTTGPATGGTLVHIRGNHLSGATKVFFGRFPAASFTVQSDVEIDAVTPNVTGMGDPAVRVTTPGGSSGRVAGVTFHFTHLPVVVSVNPNQGPLAGGTTVVIRGMHFSPHKAQPTVFFGKHLATVSSFGRHFVDAVAPPGKPGTVDIRVRTIGGTSAVTAADQFTYGFAPTVTGVSPSSGPATGKNTVTVSGTNFFFVKSVDFGGQPGHHLVVDPSGLSLTVSAPAGTAGTTVDVTVTTRSGTSGITPADEYTYTASGPDPSVTSVSPAAGPTTGMTTVTIGGAGFTGATSVQFGTNQATNVVVNSDSSITATSPAGSGTVDVTVTTPGGTSADNPPDDQFAYEDAPTVTSIVPSRGPAFGGTSVTISGTGFAAATAVQFGPNAATSYTVVSPTEVTAMSPAGSGTVDVLVTNPVGTSSAVAGDEFTYILGTAEAWGANSAGQLGNGTTTDVLNPGPVSDLPMVVDMSSGGNDFSNAVTFMGDVYAWGDNTLDELGTGNTTSSTTPVPVVGPGGTGTLSGMVAVASGDASGYALSATGNVYAWGDNAKGELGNNSTTDSSTPVEVVGPGGSGFLSGVVAISSRGNAAYALTASGNVYAWGNNAFGELGDGSMGGQSDVPVLVQQVGGGGALSNVAAVSAGAQDGYAILAGGQVVSFGYDVDGELGNGTSGSANNSDLPVDVTGLNDAVAVTGGVFHALAVTTTGAVEAWGSNASNDLGLPSFILGSETPVTVSGVSNAVEVNAGDGFSLALTSSGDIFAWGENADGELGLGTQSSTPTMTPTEITSMTAFEAVGAGWTQSLGIEN